MRHLAHITVPMHHFMRMLQAMPPCPPLILFFVDPVAGAARSQPEVPGPVHMLQQCLDQWQRGAAQAQRQLHACGGPGPLLLASISASNPLLRRRALRSSLGDLAAAESPGDKEAPEAGGK